MFDFGFCMWGFVTWDGVSIVYFSLCWFRRSPHLHAVYSMCTGVLCVGSDSGSGGNLEEELPQADVVSVPIPVVYGRECVLLFVVKSTLPHSHTRTHTYIHTYTHAYMHTCAEPVPLASALTPRCASYMPWTMTIPSPMLSVCGYPPYAPTAPVGL
jgi:hypothetical protein